MCQLESTLSAAKGEFRFLIAFVLAGFVARAVSMWALRRTNYASLCGNARNLNLMISGLLPINPDNEGEVATLLARPIMLEHYII